MVRVLMLSLCGAHGGLTRMLSSREAYAGLSLRGASGGRGLTQGKHLVLLTGGRERERESVFAHPHLQQHRGAIAFEDRVPLLNKFVQ